MNKLNMSIYTGTDDENKVTLTASFATHEAAVKFHEGLAALCKQHSPSAKRPHWWEAKRAANIQIAKEVAALSVAKR